jgi:hypothetical protein
LGTAFSVFCLKPGNFANDVKAEYFWAKKKKLPEKIRTALKTY